MAKVVMVAVVMAGGFVCGCVGEREEVRGAMDSKAAKEESSYVNAPENNPPFPI